MGNFFWGKRACGIVLFFATTAIALPAQTYSTLYSFCSQTGCKDGAAPQAGLVQATNGELFGTTTDFGPNGGGTIFTVTPSTGAVTTFYGFCTTIGCVADSHAVLIQGPNGNFYGTTYGGGANFQGSVFVITPGGALTTLYSFCSQTGCADGENPDAGLALGTDGNFYGTTLYGGAHGTGNTGGTVFKVTPGGVLTTLYSFCAQSGCADGELPYAGLVQATDENFYGTTSVAGTNNRGTIFKITPGGTFTSFHSFDVTDGEDPISGLIQGTDGNLYGTTVDGGSHLGGTAFKITLGGALTTIYNFCSLNGFSCTDGEAPSAALLQATDGNFYGTASGGGASGDGTVFALTAAGTLTTLHSFDDTDGNYPAAALIQSTNGTFYGTTSEGGANGTGGTVFSLSVGLGPFVETQPTTGPVGKAVKILGTNLTGTTSVTFNGTPAVFAVDSRSLITTTVPAGATSGTVRVVTPAATLKSNVPFRVRP